MLEALTHNSNTALRSEPYIHIENTDRDNLNVTDNIVMHKHKWLGFFNLTYVIDTYSLPMNACSHPVAASVGRKCLGIGYPNTGYVDILCRFPPFGYKIMGRIHSPADVSYFGRALAVHNNANCVVVAGLNSKKEWHLYIYTKYNYMPGWNLVRDVQTKGPIDALQVDIASQDYGKDMTYSVVKAKIVDMHEKETWRYKTRILTYKSGM